MTRGQLKLRLKTKLHGRYRHVSMLAAAMMLAAMSQLVGSQTLTDAAKLADIAQFRSEFLARDRAYSPSARLEAERRLASLQERLAAVDGTRFGLELAQIVALADNGHTASYGGPRLARHNRVDIRMAPFGADFHVVRSRDSDADLLGAKLLAIDEVPIDQLRVTGRTLTGGLPAWRDRQTPFLLESPQLLYALGVTRSGESAVYRFATLDGRSVNRRLVGQQPSNDRPRADTASLLLPETITKVDGGWLTLLPLARAPWSLRDAGQPLRWRHVPELSALVVDMRQTSSSPNAQLPEFFEAVRAASRELKPNHLVLDLRLNSGGDLTQARDFAESLPALVPGRVFVLTSAWTFSAAIAITGYLKQAAPARVRIVGEAIGDRLEFFAEGTPVKLTHSAELVLPATERHDYVDGCRHYSDCHEPVVRRPIIIATLAPDIVAPWTIDNYRLGVDPAWVAVATELRPAAAPLAIAHGRAQTLALSLLSATTRKTIGVIW